MHPSETSSSTTKSTTNMSVSTAAVFLLRHVPSLFYQLLLKFFLDNRRDKNNAFGNWLIVIFSIAVANSSTMICLATTALPTAFASAAASSSSSSPSSQSSLVSGDTEYELHAAHISIDTIMMAVDNSNDLSQLTFEPNFLHFDELSVGETANKVVTIYNRHANRSVYLGSISGSVSDFYSSFFEENLVPPMGNTTFNVVFLPRQQAVIQAHLIIHTSFGVLNYEVKGKGVECRYRLTPLIGLKAPMNATLTPEVIMYNPYDTPLQIVEVYSSGGQFQLELPTNDDDFSSNGEVTRGNSNNVGSSNSERSQTLWEIPPYCSKPVIRVRFTATSVGNHTAYIRIKVSTKKNAALEKAVIVLPIEVEIFKEHGIYSSTPFLDFGLGGTNDRPKNMLFKLLNSGKEPLEIDTYTVEAEANVKNGISLEMDTVTEATNETYQTITATVDWSRLSVDRFFRGNILIQTRRKNSSENSSKLNRSFYRIPFVGGILRGSIQFNESITRFHIPSGDEKFSKVPTTRDFRIKNNFDVTLAVTNISMSLETQTYFRAEKFKMKLLAPGEESTLFEIIQQPAAAAQSITRSFHLHTNISVYEIELFSFNGLLKRLLPITEQTKIKAKDIDAYGVDEKSINFGILPLSTLSHTMLALVNQNPIAINIHNWKGTISSAAHIGIIVPGCGKLSMQGLKFCNMVKPGEWIVFQIGVTSNTVGTFEGKFTVQTDYEVISTPIRFSTDMGILKFTTKMIDKTNCFPGGVCMVNLTAYSTFTRTMNIKNIHADTIGIHYAYDDEEKPLISAQGESYIDQLKIVVGKLCDEKCALSLAHLDDGTTTVLDAERNDLLDQQLDRFRALSSKYQKISFHVQTNHIKRYDFNGSIEFVWPKLVKGPIEFPIAQVGHELIKYVEVTNPTNDTIQLFYRIHNAERYGIDFGLPPEVVDECPNCFLTPDSVFSLENDKHTSPIHLIQPKTTTQIIVKFAAENPGNYGSLLYIHNNFTVLEAIWLTAKAVVPQFKFGNRKPGSKTPLLFELTDKHLRDCNHPNVNMRSVTAKRTFTAKNSGEVPIYLHTLRIDNLPCEGYGYRIMDCAPFELTPNGSKKIEISFTPDFTLAMVKKTLYIDTSLNYSVNYTLLSMIAPLSLSVCSKALARPEWESLMKNVTVIVMAFTFLCVIIAAYLDAMKVLKVHVDNMSKAKGAVQPTLDLRNIGLKNLFGEDAPKGQLAASNAASGSTAMSNASTNSKQMLSTPTCNGKSNGSACKKKSAEKKRATSVSTENVSTKKSWASEIAKKFTSQKKSDTKPKEPPAPAIKPKGSPPSTSQSDKQTGNKKDKRPKDETLNTSYEEEETSSTTTESSSHSDDKSPNAKTKSKKSSQSKDLPASSASQSKESKKTVVKKSKSLPLSYESPDVENALTVPSSVVDKNNKDQIGKSLNAPDSVINQSNVMAEESSKCDSSSPEFSHLTTPPNKSQPLKMINGKTPGRERNKPNENLSLNKKLTDRENATTFKANAFEFSSPLTESPTSGHPLLDFRKTSFSSVLQTSKPGQSSSSSSSASPPTIPVAANKASESVIRSQKSTKVNSTGKIKLESGTKSKDGKKSKSKHSASLDDSVFGVRQAFESVPDDGNAKMSSPGIDLGPIGTRKSPSSTPVWEPMHSIHNPIPLNMNTNHQHLLNNMAGTSTSSSNSSNSFFSGIFPPTSTYQRNSSALNDLLSQHQMKANDQLNNFRQQLQAAETINFLNGVYSNSELEQQKQQQLWDSAILLNLLQQQQHQKQLQNRNEMLQRSHLSGSAPALPLNVAAHLGSPSALQPDVFTSTSNWNSTNVFEPSLTNQSSWSATSNAHEVRRPPPGFPAREQTRLAQQALLYRHQQQQLQLQKQQQQQQQLQQLLQMQFQKEREQQQSQQPAQNASDLLQFNAVSDRQPAAQDQRAAHLREQQSLEPQYDPFKISSIWRSDFPSENQKKPQ